MNDRNYDKLNEMLKEANARANEVNKGRKPYDNPDNLSGLGLYTEDERQIALSNSKPRRIRVKTKK